MLQIRLKDKNYDVASSDLKITKVVAFFESNGTDSERQEAYYYAGSVYRDLKDTPRAISYFLKSVKEASGSSDCDSVLLRNAYSNLNCLYYDVQDFRNALGMALKEFMIAEQLHILEPTNVMHVANAYVALDSVRKAKDFYKLAVACLDKSEGTDDDVVNKLLLQVSSLKDEKYADVIYKRFKSWKRTKYNSGYYLALAEYYLLKCEDDSAACSYKKVLEIADDDYAMYDASKSLFKLYSGNGQLEEANNYAKMFIGLTEKIDLGRRQELAASVNNKFQYNVNKEKLAKIEQRESMYKKL